MNNSNIIADLNCNSRCLVTGQSVIITGPVFIFQFRLFKNNIVINSMLALFPELNYVCWINTLSYNFFHEMWKKNAQSCFDTPAECTHVKIHGLLLPWALCNIVYSLKVVTRGQSTFKDISCPLVKILCWTFRKCLLCKKYV